MNEDQKNAIVNLWLTFDPNYSKYTDARCTRESQAIRRVIRAFHGDGVRIKDIRAIIEEI